MMRKFTSFLMVLTLAFCVGTATAQTYLESKQIAPLTDIFSATWKMTPSHAPMSGATGMSKGEVSAWGDYAIIVNATPAGYFTIRNGKGYALDDTVRYVADSTYVIKVTGDVKAQTYSVEITDPSGAKKTVATDYEFRTNTEQDELNFFCTKVDTNQAYGGVPGSEITASYMDDPFVEDPYPSAGNSSYALAFTNNYGIEAQTGAFKAVFDVTPMGDGADCAVGLTEDPSAIGGYTNYGAYVIFEKGGLIGVGKGGTTGWPTQNKPAYEIGKTYTVVLDIDVAAHTYTATVTGDTLTDRVLVSDHEFRDVNATELNNLATQVSIGGLWGGKPGYIKVENIKLHVDNWKEITISGDKPSARGYGDMASLGNGKALLFGGSTGGHSGDADSLTWVYDTNTDTWTKVEPSGTIPPTRYKHMMAYAGDDKVVMFGGHNDASTFLGDTWIYDYSENSWTQSASAPTELYPRFYSAFAYIGDNKVVLYGGEDNGGAFDDMWLYDAASDTWEELDPADAPGKRLWGQMCYIGDDKVMMYGGNVKGAESTETWVYDLSDNAWTHMNVSGPSVEIAAGAAYLGDGNAMVFGGLNGGWSKATWIYNLELNTWAEELESTPPLGNRIPAICETSMDGSSPVVVFGGRHSGGNTSDGTWEFNIDTWSPINGLEDELLNPVSAGYSLNQNYPNPFNPTTTIQYFLPKVSDVEIAVYNVVGQKVATLVNSNQPAGEHNIVWNGTNQQGIKAASGVYLFRIVAGDFVKTRKMILLK
jgi:hypothetical protein